MLENKLDFANAANRRGLMLGLTLAEIMMIILFALLLLLGAVLAEQEQERERLAELEKQAAADLANKDTALAAVDALKGVMAEAGLLPNDIDDVVKELTLALQLKQEVAGLEEEESALTSSPAPDAKAKLEEIRKKLAEKKAEQAKARQALERSKAKLAEASRRRDTTTKIAQELAEAGVTPEKAKDIDKTLAATRMVEEGLKQKLDRAGVDKLAAAAAVEQARKEWADTALDNRNLGEQSKYWKVKWEEGTGKKGVTPCWATNGVPDFIFDVALTDSGIILRRNEAVPQWADDWARLPVEDITFLQQISQAEFVAKTRPLFEYSVKKDCRFFVRLFDETGTTAKLIYQQRRRAVEGHFYILDMKDAHFVNMGGGQ